MQLTGSRPVPAFPAKARFAALFALSESIYLLCFLLPFPLLRFYRQDIDMGAMTDHSHVAYWRFVLSFTILFVVFGYGAHLMRHAHGHRPLLAVLGGGAVYITTLIFVYPATAIDIFAYIDQSRIMLHYHQNPIFVAPAAFPSDPLMPLSDGWSGAGAPYGPLGLVIDAAPTILSGGNLLASLILVKLAFGAMVLLCAYLVYRILAQVCPESAVQGALLVAWNPLLLFEGVANGHNDTAMMLFALLGLLSLVEDDFLLGWVLLFAACLIKFATLLLMPIALVYVLSHLRSTTEKVLFVVKAVALALCIGTLAYVRFWEGPSTLAHLAAQDQRYLVSFASVATGYLGGAAPLPTTTVVGRVLFGCVYGYALYLAAGSKAELLRACFIAALGALMFAVTNVESWYGIWVVILAAAAPGRAERAGSLLFAWGISLAAAFFGYEWWWRGLSTPGSFTYINAKSYLVAFLPAALAFALLRVPGSERLWQRLRPSLQITLDHGS